MKLLIDRSHCRLEYTIDTIFHINGIGLCLYMNIARSALDCGVDHRINQFNYRADVTRESLDGQAFFTVFIFSKQLKLKTLGRLVKHALGAFALGEHFFNGGGSSDGNRQWRTEKEGKFVNHREISGVRYDDHEHRSILPMRHKAVPKHEFCRDRTK